MIRLFSPWKIASFFLILPSLLFGSGRKNAENELWQKALGKGLNYLQQNDTVLNFQTIMLYDFLRMKFNLPPLATIRDSANPDKTGTYPYLFARLIDGTVRVEQEEINFLRNSIDRLTASALYCDKFDFTDSILINAQLQSDKGGYYLTHALFALQLMKENGCATSRLSEFQKLEKEITGKVISFIDHADFMNDEVIEAVAFLYYSKQDNLVKPEWINKIATLQTADGGWMRAVKKTQSNGKTTTLAVWVLLEALQPEVKDISWMKKEG